MRTQLLFTVQAGSTPTTDDRYRHEPSWVQVYCKEQRPCEMKIGINILNY